MPDVRRAIRRLGLPGPRLLRPAGVGPGASRAAAAGAALLAATLLGAAPAPAPSPSVAPSPVPAPATAAGPVQVRFVEPAPPGLILGPTRITIEAATAPGARLVEVALYVDGALLTSFARPPYAVTWDAGSRFTRRVLRAVATDSEGRTGEATLVTRPLYVGQYEEVRLISVYATVRDRRGEPVPGLTRDDFVLEEDGVPQSITHFTAANVPLAVALLVDASNSMNLSGKIDFARRAAEDFVASVDPDDRLTVAWFNDRLQGLEAPVADRKRLREAIGSITASGGTALYDAVYRTAERLAGAEGRRAIVLLSDGRDQAETDNEPGSLHLFEEALERAHRSEAAVYAVGLGRHLDTEMDLQDVHSLKEILETFARQTGGRAFFPERPGELSAIYRQIAADLKHQYVIAYAPVNRSRDGRWRTIALRTRDPRQTVEARAGYYAPGPADR